MSIQTTMKMCRDIAEARIKRILELVSEEDYKEIERITGEYDYNHKHLVDFVQEYLPKAEGEIAKLSKMTEGMLEEYMDSAYFRFSIFENYRIVDCENEE